jgi:tRNA-dihydrouridine synthase
MATPGVAERFGIALEHARLVRAYEADPAGAAIEFRKHLGWYVKGLPDSADLRRRLHLVNSFDEVEGIFSDYLNRSPWPRTDALEHVMRKHETSDAPR